MFEGETDHLVPTTSAVLVESELFVMAGRLIGHSLINGGPTLSGISLAVVHALTSGSKELATTYLSLEDCPDIDHRDIIGSLLKEEMTEEETSRLSSLCMEWYFPVPTKETNKLLLLQQLLTHAAITRLSAQIKHLKRGLKETGVWPLITSRLDVVPLLFPRESEVEITPQMVLQSIIWPQAKQSDDSDDSDDDLEAETTQVTGFFHQFLEEASSDNLRQLMRFWVGWEVPCQELKLEVIQSTGPNHMPTSSTCSERLRLPSHYSTYQALYADMMVCLKSVETGFGLV
ncbi:uncharacterized protein LOC103133377 isoform X2 [Poecilia formosa]|nr:PREDICTED: uncharacterized protein LOC103133377 isoform X2 [Poecilia formosa]